MATIQDTQEKILSIMIRHKGVVNDVIDKGITESHFDLKYRPLFCGIIDANISSVGLTEHSFQIFIQKNFKNGNYAKWTANKDSQENMAVIGERNQFFKVVNSSDATPDDLHALIDVLKEDVLKRQTTEAISKFSDQSKGNFRGAAQNLSERLGSILDEQQSAIDFIRLSDYSEEFMKDLQRRKDHPEECLYTGIKEIDSTMQVGLRPGTLTLFAADVGGFKTTMMLNIAINIYKNTNETVLFIPLEMPYDMLVRKIVAREANVPLAEIEKASLLKPEQEKRIAQEIEKFKSEASRFVILDPRERTTVASIARAIEKRKAKLLAKQQGRVSQNLFY
jgi:replicative DNA helicase